MKTRLSLLIAATPFLAIAGAQAQAVSGSTRTRADVRAETADAVRVGEVPGFDGLKMVELLPTMYSPRTTSRPRMPEVATTPDTRDRLVVDATTAQAARPK